MTCLKKVMILSFKSHLDYVKKYKMYVYFINHNLNISNYDIFVKSGLYDFQHKFNTILKNYSMKLTNKLFD